MASGLALVSVTSTPIKKKNTLQNIVMTSKRFFTSLLHSKFIQFVQNMFILRWKSPSWTIYKPFKWRLLIENWLFHQLFTRENENFSTDINLSTINFHRINKASDNIRLVGLHIFSRYKSSTRVLYMLDRFSIGSAHELLMLMARRISIFSLLTASLHRNFWALPSVCVCVCCVYETLRNRIFLIRVCYYHTLRVLWMREPRLWFVLFTYLFEFASQCYNLWYCNIMLKEWIIINNCAKMFFSFPIFAGTFSRHKNIW